MTLKKKFGQKIFAIILALAMVVNPVWSTLAFAEEPLPTETITPTIEPIETSEDNSSPSGNIACSEAGSSGPTPTEAPPESTVQTGDAAAVADLETSANTNRICLEGEVSSPENPCDLPVVTSEEDCPTCVMTENQALVDNEASVSAETGDNGISNAAGDATIESGEAVAGASLDNQINTNELNFTPSDSSSGIGGESESVSELMPEEQTEETGPSVCPVVVVNQNEGELSNTATVSATSGDNRVTNSQGTVMIDSGNVVAWANLVNLMNMNVVGSDFEIALWDYLSGKKGDVDLNQLWEEITDQGQAAGVNWQDPELMRQFLNFNFNWARLTNQVSVAADSGGNQANGNGSDASVDTGSAAALANVVNLVNFNLFGSQFLLVVMNIFGGFEGDLILPRPENFQNGSSGNDSGAVISNQNQAEISNQVSSEADTGDNQAVNNGGETTIETGQAQAAARVLNWTNLNVIGNQWFSLLINLFGSWQGKILGWASPEARQDGDGNGQLFQTGSEANANGPSGENEEIPNLVFNNQNQATVSNQIQTTASTGGNQANNNVGNTSITTGPAFSLANLFNLVNLNVLGGRWFLGVVNILGDWKGNLVFAYPDVAVSLTNGSGQVAIGETTQYSLSYQNIGYDEANDVWVKMELPRGVTYLSDSSGLEMQSAGGVYSWRVGSLAPKKGGSFTIQVKVEPDFQASSQSLSFWSWLVPQAQAAENEEIGEIVTVALINTGDPESDTGNNSASVKTTVYSPKNESSSQEGVDQRQPTLEITAWNNVNEFVYPGDIVTFEVKINNRGDVAAEEVYFVQKLYNGLPDKDFGAVNLKVGRIEAGKGVKISFGLKLVNNNLIRAGRYHTVAWVEGKAPNGNLVTSNQARTDFEVRLRDVASLFDVKAAEEEKVLGAQTEDVCPAAENENILPYVLLFILSSAWLVEKSRRLVKAWGN